MVDRSRQIGTGEQPPLLPHLDGDGAGADAGQDLAGERIGHIAQRRSVQHQRGGVRGGEAVVEAVEPEVRDRGHIDQHAGDRHQGDRQEQQLAGQAKPTYRLGPVLLRCRWLFGH